MEEKIIKNIKENWFNNHIAKLIDKDDIQILEWSKPNSYMYYIRYIFDGYNMYISGDLGSAVFRLTWKGNVHSFKNINHYYFLEKIEAFSNDIYNFDNVKAKNELLLKKEEYIDDYLRSIGCDKSEIEGIEEHDSEYSGLIENFDNMINGVESCENKQEYKELIDEYEDFLFTLDDCYYEWIYSLGDVINSRILSYLIGLQMASKQLEENHD